MENFPVIMVFGLMFFVGLGFCWLYAKTLSDLDAAKKELIEENRRHRTVLKRIKPRSVYKK
jgi:hypothetical protein